MLSAMLTHSDSLLRCEFGVSLADRHRDRSSLFIFDSDVDVTSQVPPFPAFISFT